MIYLSRNLHDTAVLGKKIATILRPGDILALSGDLGVGKTQLVRAIVANYLNENTHVSSPSFTIINRYETADKRVHHLDLYRLSNLEELESAGYWDAVEDSEALVLIEWLEQVEKAKPINYTQIWINYVEENGLPIEDVREFHLIGDVQDSLFQRLFPVFNSNE